MDLNGTFYLGERILTNEDCDKPQAPPSMQCVGVDGTRESRWVGQRLEGMEGQKITAWQKAVPTHRVAFSEDSLLL